MPRFVANVVCVSNIGYGIPEAVVGGFRQAGHRATLLQSARSPYPLTFRIAASVRRIAAVDRENQDFHDRLLRYRPSTAIDLLLYLKGNDPVLIAPLTEKLASRWRPRHQVVWMFDPLDRLQGAAELAEQVDAVFTYERGDAERLAARGHAATYLPAAFDPAVFKPAERAQDIDVFFAGGFLRSLHRMKLLTALAAAARSRGWRMVLAGHRLPWWRLAAAGSMATALSAVKGFRLNRTLAPAIVNRYYQRSKICLNIHENESIGCWNPRSFEILGAGACQIVDHRPGDANLFQSGVHLQTYQGPDELVEVVACLLDDPLTRDRLARAGRIEAAGQHTYQHRAATILNQLLGAAELQADDRFRGARDLGGADSQ